LVEGGSARCFFFRWAWVFLGRRRGRGTRRVVSVPARLAVGRAGSRATPRAVRQWAPCRARAVPAPAHRSTRRTQTSTSRLAQKTHIPSSFPPSHPTPPTHTQQHRRRHPVHGRRRPGRGKPVCVQDDRAGLGLARVRGRAARGPGRRRRRGRRPGRRGPGAGGGRRLQKVRILGMRWRVGCPALL
jgi:hypothetical protein